MVPTVGSSKLGLPVYPKIHSNKNHNKILKSDWLSTVLISTLIGQYDRTSCLSNNGQYGHCAHALEWPVVIFTS